MAKTFSNLFSPLPFGAVVLKNRIVMAPMTRSRAIGNIPNELMAQYYASRAGSGLIITEGTAPSANGLGYPRIPGCYSAEQIQGWRLVTEAVHDAGGRIFLQIMHTGRVSHPDNLPVGAEVVAPSAIAATEMMYTDQSGMQPVPTPRALNTEEIPAIIEEYVHCAKSAIEAGFDGVELHGANGYLIEQFLNSGSNQRTDLYGGSLENRNRFAVEIAQAVVLAIGKERVGIRISPFGVYNSMASDEHTAAQYLDLMSSLSEIGILYVHVVDHASMGAPALPVGLKASLREQFKGIFILSGGYDGERAEQALAERQGDLVAFGRPFIANPDLPQRIIHEIALASPDHQTFYTPGERGYTDYAAATIA